MSERIHTRGQDVKSESTTTTKKRKAYKKPAFQHERVFETMALSCGKMHSTQATCFFHRNAS